MAPNFSLMRPVRRKKVLILGHSYIHRLLSFVNSEASKKYKTMHVSGGHPGHFQLAECQVDWLGIGGMCVSSLLDTKHPHYREVDARLKLFNPEIIVIQLGENDLDRYGSSTTKVVHLMKCLVRKLYNDYGVSNVIVGQLIPREKPNTNTFNEQVREANDCLFKNWQGSKHTCFWKIKGIWKSKNSVYNKKDGIHFNELGHYRLYQSYRAALIALMKRLE